MNYFIDTNVIIDFLEAEKLAVECMRKLVEQHVFISSIVAAELYRGVFLSENKREAERVAEFIKTVEIKDFDHKSAQIFGQKYAQLKKAGKITQEVDLLIASVCLAHDGVFVTRNSKDFKNIEGLKILAV